MAPDRNRARFHIKVVKKPARSGAAGNRPQCRRCASVCRFGAMLLLYAGLQPAVTKCIGTAARNKA